MANLTWTRDGDLRVATLGDCRGSMLPVGSRFALKVGDVSGLDDEATARRCVEEMLTGQSSPAVFAAPAPAANELPAWAQVPGDDGRAVRRDWTAEGDDGRAVRRDWTAEQYHADSRVSRSDLVEFEESARLYHGRRRERSIPPRPQTAAMRFGTLVHMRVLEPEEFRRRAWIKPEQFNGRTNAGKSELADIRARSMIECEMEEAQRIEGCAAALLADPDARKLLEHCEREVTFTWTERVRLLDDTIEVPCRSRLDLFTARRGRALIGDLKTADDPRPDEFVRAAVRLGYHYQPPFYARPVRDLYGCEPEFRFIIVRNRPPHEVVVCRVNADDVKAFDKMLRRTLERFAECVLTDTWSSPWERRGVTDLEFPRWALESKP